MPGGNYNRSRLDRIEAINEAAATRRAGPNDEFRRHSRQT
jgi:hypothetical protein